MARPRLFDEPLTPAERARRYRRRKQLRVPLRAFVLPRSEAVTKSIAALHRTYIDIQALIG